ncbi:hypothetical protein KKG51_05015 [Patescibacteria group bacterium]|nr:hypothetical protein [Patescibacteria group bacterium]
MDYKKYYHLEDYLFGEVSKNFHKRKYLLPEEFFCIVIWKSNRAKTKIKKKLLKFGDLKVVIKDITSQIFLTSKSEEKLEILLKRWTFSLPMATAILTVLYPNDFTIYDVRVRNQRGEKEISRASHYFNSFLPAVREKGRGKNLRDKDRFLWGKSFYEDLKKLLKD